MHSNPCRWTPTTQGTGCRGQDEAGLAGPQRPRLACEAAPPTPVTESPSPCRHRSHRPLPPKGGNAAPDNNDTIRRVTVTAQRMSTKYRPSRPEATKSLPASGSTKLKLLRATLPPRGKSQAEDEADTGNGSPHLTGEVKRRASDGPCADRSPRRAEGAPQD